MKNRTKNPTGKNQKPVGWVKRYNRDHRRHNNFKGKHRGENLRERKGSQEEVGKGFAGGGKSLKART